VRWGFVLSARGVLLKTRRLLSPYVIVFKLAQPEEGRVRKPHASDKPK
jgi:hypothetical protein